MSRAQQMSRHLRMSRDLRMNRDSTRTPRPRPRHKKSQSEPMRFTWSEGRRRATRWKTGCKRKRNFQKNWVLRAQRVGDNSDYRGVASQINYLLEIASETIGSIPRPLKCFLQLGRMRDGTVPRGSY